MIEEPDKSRNSRRLEEDDCLEFYRLCKTPERVIRHCRAVGDVGCAIAQSLNRAGCSFDADLIKMSGYVHDIMRIYENHGEKAAHLLAQYGFSAPAELVRDHMHYDFNKIENLDETDLMCLADRVVKEDRYVGLDERIDYLISKRDYTEQQKKKIISKKAETEKLIADIENISGETIDSLFSKEKKDIDEKE